jgi:hypothetical protein
MDRWLLQELGGALASIAACRGAAILTRLGQRGGCARVSGSPLTLMLVDAAAHGLKSIRSIAPQRPQVRRPVGGLHARLPR